MVLHPVRKTWNPNLHVNFAIFRFHVSFQGYDIIPLILTDKIHRNCFLSTLEQAGHLPLCSASRSSRSTSAYLAEKSLLSLKVGKAAKDYIPKKSSMSRKKASF